MRRWIVMAAAGAMALGLAAPGRTQAPPGTASSGRPDVLVLVLQQPGSGDLVDITYAHTVPHAQAQRDLDALAQAAGWKIGTSHITDKAPPVPKKLGLMTSIVFTVPSAIQNDTHTLPVGPFVTALRPYQRLVLIFNVASDFQFQGPRDFADGNVQIALEQHGMAFTYQVRVLNAQFTHLDLTASRPAATAAPHSSRWVLFLGILMAATAAGSLVYVLMARKNGPPPPAATDALAEERTKIGTRG